MGGRPTHALSEIDRVQPGPFGSIRVQKAHNAVILKNFLLILKTSALKRAAAER